MNNQQNVLTIHPLIERLLNQGAAWVTPQTIDAFLSSDSEQILFFHTNPARYPEVLDVAVVLPELLTAFQGRFQLGVVQDDPTTLLAKQYGVQRWPSLVFLREGQRIDCAEGILDWAQYLQLMNTLDDKMPVKRLNVGVQVVGSETTAVCQSNAR